MSNKFKRIRMSDFFDEEEYIVKKPLLILQRKVDTKSKSLYKETKKKKIEQKHFELFGSEEGIEIKASDKPKKEKQPSSKRVLKDWDKECLIIKDLHCSLARYEVDINMYSKLTPSLENQLKHMSFLLKVNCKHYKRTEETRKDYVAFKSSLNTPGLSKSYEEIRSATNEYESEQKDFICRLIERGSKFLSALKSVMSVFKQRKRALTLTFVEVLKESVDGDISKLTCDYIDECRSMCEKMLVRNQCLDFSVFFTTMHQEHFHRLVQKGIGLSQSRLVGSFTPSSTASGKYELDFYPYGDLEPG